MDKPTPAQIEMTNRFYNESFPLDYEQWTEEDHRRAAQIGKKLRQEFQAWLDGLYANYEKFCEMVPESIKTGQEIVKRWPQK